MRTTGMTIGVLAAAVVVMSSHANRPIDQASPQTVPMPDIRQLVTSSGTVFIQAAPHSSLWWATPKGKSPYLIRLTE